ncbi:hypothetical protein CDV36_015701 [Fusarium kuroshium]|uniref:EKC/KEOPS complex subunit BUD32 n=1 Tax=Fusarium kuroshium TaxID=2010991 RepID=A0A3M2R8E1_9HYPO|nr:hypothetical protein CDV36_015701 [Fusarium kuroshium]
MIWHWATDAWSFLSRPLNHGTRVPRDAQQQDSPEAHASPSLRSQRPDTTLISPSFGVQDPSQPGSIIGIGASCFVSTYDNLTVLKGYQIWVDGKLRSSKCHTCEDAVRQEHHVYEHLGTHPRILRYYGLVQVHPSVYSLRLELAPLGNVRQYIEDHEAPPKHSRIQMALDAAVGLSYIHSCKVRHADLSCRNLFLFDGLRVKIGDLGDSAVEGDGFTPTVYEEARYALPCRGRDLDERPVAKTELFALGSAIYEILAWARPFPELEDEEVEERYSRGQFPCLDSIDIGVTIMNCWKEVYETADEVAAALDIFLRSQDAIANEIQ